MRVGNSAAQNVRTEVLSLFENGNCEILARVFGKFKKTISERQIRWAAAYQKKIVLNAR